MAIAIIEHHVVVRGIKRVIVERSVIESVSGEWRRQSAAGFVITRVIVMIRWICLLTQVRRACVMINVHPVILGMVMMQVRGIASGL